MTELEVRNILKKYSEGTASESEKALLESWYLEYNSSQQAELPLYERMAALDEVWSKLESANPRTKKIRLWPKIAIAGSLLFILSFGGYLLLQQQGHSDIDLLVKNDIPAGKNAATLTLANGKKILLDQTKEGLVGTESGIGISKSSAGKLTYAAELINGDNSEPKYNTLETAKGQQYQVVLPDGSTIWLNAASSVSYPVIFSKKERSVEITGEAYFEVKKDQTRPFIVKSKGQQVEVLGTHFNVSTYADDPAIKTTLLEGSVRVSTNGTRQTAVLLPGQQASLNNGKLAISRPETEEVIAWKNGYFMFESEDIQSIMRKISRWYNIEVTYEGEIPQDTFSGTVDRYAKVSQILKKLQLTDKVRFKIEERRIIVTK
ncbi:FecR family protein [Pedobacter psychroterrae]|uniref:FecR family protein n=1 Tax=Pedobacter psychroterrae TaxID=2530453 RepID=A0A4R0NS10_9SPHI|nr:FecR family protein [Pedobacter psychroterrae]TCD03942.1 FecR family protein [Pedobacter psychroterrae]